MTDCMWAGPTIEMPANETLPSLADGLARRTPDAIVLVDECEALLGKGDKGLQESGAWLGRLGLWQG